MTTMTGTCTGCDTDLPEAVLDAADLQEQAATLLDRLDQGWLSSDDLQPE